MLGCKLVRPDGSASTSACKRGFPTVLSARSHYFTGLSRLATPTARRFAAVHRRLTLGERRDRRRSTPINGAFMLVRREAVGRGR